MTALYRDIKNSTLREVADLNGPFSNETTLEVYRKASWIGITAGLRSMMPLALLAMGEEHLPSPKLKTVTTLLAIGEIIGDKLPATPSRVSTGPFIGRLIIGAVAGALLCRREKQSPIQGAIRGAIGATIGTIGGYAYRTLAANATNVPDLLWAGLEDSVAYSLGRLAISPTPIIKNEN